MSPDGRPGMYLGVKGILYIELEAQGPSRDMHSGSAATVPNPAWRLVWALSTIKNEKEEILIPGFYDAVLSPTEREMGSFGLRSGPGPTTGHAASNLSVSTGYTLLLQTSRLTSGEVSLRPDSQHLWVPEAVTLAKDRRPCCRLRPW